MGLCKCPKRRITNQFCYEHRVNVCEYCIVTAHAKCIVLSYLQWLQDGDYNPICELCKVELQTGECARLVCYHVFHWNCINNLCSKSSSGYKCPTCNGPIIPLSNDISPVASVLREKIDQTHWGNILNDCPEASHQTVEKKYVRPPSPSLELKNTISNSIIRDTHVNNYQDNTSVIVNEEITPFIHSNVYHEGPRKLTHSNYDTKPLLYTVDHDENKYKRRVPNDRFNLWMNWSVGRRNARNNMLSRRRYIAIILFILVVVFLLLVYLLSPKASDYDPLFDPLENPNIKVEQQD